MSVPALPDVPELVAEHIRSAITRRPHERYGPFLAAFDDHSAHPGRNYAVPDTGAAPAPNDVAGLVTAFQRRGRIPRLEYVPADAPKVESALISAGFTVEGRPPILVSVPGSLAPASPSPFPFPFPTSPSSLSPTGIDFTFATTEEDLLAAATVQHQAYEEPEPAGPHDVARLRSTVARGGLIILARDAVTGDAVGSGLVDGPLDGIGELAAVAVAEPYRRRGIAGAMSVRLAIQAHEQGMRLVWLEAAPAEESIYLRAGFSASGRKLWISRP